ncbi:MAG: hypothetical protein LBD45_04640 [Bacteroidales bacterium]|nr:hypothetical protein [Bacteroidales bacterium]
MARLLWAILRNKATRGTSGAKGNAKIFRQNVFDLPVTKSRSLQVSYYS